MVDAAPFRGLRYDPAVTGDVRTTSAPALDEVDRFDYARHRTAGPYTVLELLAGTEVAASTFARWRRTGVLALDDRPAFYAYEQRSAHHLQRGLLAAVRVERGDPEAILPHEDVDAARVAARLERLLAVGVDIAPVFAVTTGLPQPARRLIDDLLAGPPLAELTDEAGTVHRLAVCGGSVEVTALRDALADVAVLIADGHHRYAAAVAAGLLGGDDRTLMLIVDAAGTAPLILPVHRLLRALAPGWRDRLAPAFHLLPAPADAEALVGTLAGAPEGTVALRTPGAGFLVAPADLPALRAALPPGHSARWRRLDTALVDAALLPRLGDPAQVRYRADLDAAAEVDRDGGALVLVRPVALATVRELAARGELLPPKTTSFRPKPRTGMVLRPRDGVPSA